jgi:hypothetical protein
MNLVWFSLDIPDLSGCPAEVIDWKDLARLAGKNPLSPLGRLIPDHMG